MATVRDFFAERGGETPLDVSDVLEAKRDAASWTPKTFTKVYMDLDGMADGLARMAVYYSGPDIPDPLPMLYGGTLESDMMNFMRERNAPPSPF